VPNGLTQFSSDHHYASGIILVTVGVVGAIGALTGELANLLAALWVPDILETASGQQADSGGLLGGANSAANGLLIINPATGPTAVVGGLVQKAIQWVTG
jgi:hypothetical protein